MIHPKAGFQFCCLIVSVVAYIFGGHTSLAATTEKSRFSLLGRDAHGGTDAAISRDGKFVVTSSSREGSFDLWMLDVEAGEWTQLTFGKTDEIEPQWSPDGRKIAYTSLESGNKDVFWLAVDDKKPTRLTTSTEDDEYPSWAPDSKRIVFTTGPWKKRHFMIVDTSLNSANGVVAEKVNEVSGHVGACTFHNSGDSLLCHTYENGFGDIVHLKLDGQLIKKITNGQMWDYKPHIARDNRRVAFSRITSNSSSIYIKALDDEKAIQVTSSIDNDRWPMFYQKDNVDYLFFHRLVNRGASIVVYNRDTQETELIAGSDEQPLRAAFDRSSNRVAYCAVLNGKNVLRIYDRKTKQRTKLDVDGREACYPVWSEDGSQIAFLTREKSTWQLAMVNLENGVVEKLTSEKLLPNGIAGPLDWSKSAQKITFTANTSPYESDVFVYDLVNNSLNNLTNDDWYDESASWDNDGNILFMSTRGGAWTWGLFRLMLDGSKEFSVISEPNYVEKNYPRESINNSLVWSEHRMCDATEYIAIKDPQEPVRLLRDLPGARWPSFSKDGSEILFTQVQKYLEFWSVNVDQE